PDPCPECEPSSECVTARCVDGGCVEEPVADGTLCGEGATHVCVGGSCVMRGCGDGFREPGPDPMREGCDDGNRMDGDACSPDCEPTSVLVEGSETGDFRAVPTSQARAVGVDGDGRVLLVWTRDVLDNSAIYARRYTAAGVPRPLAAEDPLVIDVGTGSPPTGHPTVVGRAAGGWVVAWSAERAGSRDIVLVLVEPEGTIGAEIIANEVRGGAQHRPRLAALDDGFVVAWEDRVDRPEDPRWGVRARRFAEHGAPLGGDLVVATDTSDYQGDPALAAAGNGWMLAWAHWDPFDGETPPRLLARRYQEGTPTDTEPVELTPDGGFQPSAAALEPGTYAIAWGSFHEDGFGNLYARVLDPADTSPDPADIVTVAGMADHRERLASVAPLSATDYLVAWEDEGPAHVRFAVSSGATLAPEADALQMRLAMGAEGHVSVTGSPDGVWFAWAGEAETSTEGLSAYHLPID
ncbi:MAG: hypothetical protein ACOCUS_01940, partial [Polyangiales bacterium]